MTKHSQMKVIVLRPCANPAAPDTVAPAEIPVATTRLYNTSTEVINVKDGFGAFFKEVTNSGNPESVHGTTTPAGVNAPIRFIQNRDTTQDRSPLYSRPFEESQWISSQCFLGVKISQQNASLPCNNMIFVGPDASTGSVDIPVLDEFTYRLQVSGHGDRTDWYNSVYNTPTVFGTYTSPDWTTTSYTTAEARALTIESLAYNFNGNNQNIAVMVCLETAASGSTGNILLTALTTPATYPNGTKFTIGYTLAGQPVTITMDNAIREAFAALETANPGMELRPYLLPGTTPAPAGVPIAGDGTVVTDNFAFLAIDEGQAYYDYKMATKRRITVGLIKGFDNVLQEVVALPEEGTGLGRQLSIMYKANEQYNQTARPQPYMSYHVSFPNEILENGFYDLFFVEHCHQRLATSGMPAVMPHTTVIAVLNHTLGGSLLVNPYYNATANPQKTYLVDTLNAFDTNFVLGNANLSV